MHQHLLTLLFALYCLNAKAGVCTREYAPVCGQVLQQTQTFSNRCLMHDSGASWLSNGECPQAHVKNITLTVAAEDVACLKEGAMRCLRVKMGKNPAWSNFYDSIEGFTFTPGVQYKLLLSATPITNPPVDGSTTHFALVRVLWRKPAH
jgi:hypothetical protein